MKTYILIPAYCPDQKLVETVQELRRRDYETVVVNDGSPDVYRTIFDSLDDCHVIHLEHNSGKGTALKTGIAWIDGHCDEPYGIITADADGQHLVSDIVRMDEEMRQNPGCLILGARSFSEKDVPLRSRFGNRLTAALFTLITGIAVHDTQTGLRAFDFRLCQMMLKTEGSRYEYEMNVLLACKTYGIRIVETTITTVYENGNSGSHFRVLRDSLRIYSGILRFAASSFSCFLIDITAFAILHSLLGFVPVAANITARFISASCGYLINSRLVFRNKDGSILRYALLVMVILFFNSWLLYALNGILRLPVYAAKLLCEITMFLVSWTVQNRFIFAKEAS